MGNRRSRGRKGSGKTKKLPVISQSTSSVTIPASKSITTSRFRFFRRLGLLRTVLGIIAPSVAIFSFLVFTFQQTKPQIRIAVNDPRSAFMFPFFVKNSSLFFNMYDVGPICEILKVNSNWSNLDLRSTPIPTIKAGDEKPLQCVIAEMPMDVRGAEQALSIRYKTRLLGMSIERTSAPNRFVWQGEASNPQWVPYGESK